MWYCHNLPIFKVYIPARKQENDYQCEKGFEFHVLTKTYRVSDNLNV